jgi:hypothetical protein
MSPERSLPSVFALGLLVAAVVLAGVGGTTVALEDELSEPYPHSPGSNVLQRVSVTAESGDAVVQSGLEEATIDFGVDNRFDGSFGNVTRVDVLVSGRDPIPANFSTSDNGQITIDPARRISLEAGDRMFFRIFNFTTPSVANPYRAQVTLTSGEGATDTATVNYPITRTTLSFPNQTAPQFGSQSVELSGTVPNFGYIGVFEVDGNGRGELVGSTATGPDHDPQNFTVDLNGNVTESQALQAVVFYETRGETLDERRNGTFDPATDRPFTNTGQVVSATGFATTIDADARLEPGREYAPGTGLYFAGGEPGTGYQVRRVEDGSLAGTATQFETGSDGTATFDTADVGTGRYAITTVAEPGEVLSIDDDSTTSAADDSFVVAAGASGSATTGGSADAGGTDGGATGDDAASPDDGSTGTTETIGPGAGPTTGDAAGPDDGGPNDGGAATATPGDEETGGIMGLLQQGFVLTAGVAAVLAIVALGALLAVRRRRGGRR